MLARNLKKDDIIIVSGTRYIVLDNLTDRVTIAMEKENGLGNWLSDRTCEHQVIDDCRFTMFEVDWKARLEVAKNGFV
jgi:hypothetical protein